MPISFNEDEKIIIEKIQSYCLYQDRCIKEVKNKLYSFKVSSQLVENIVEYLIDNDYLNEERYTKMFIQGKLRIKKWGRIKLKYELRSKGIDIKIINEHINWIKKLKKEGINIKSGFLVDELKRPGDGGLLILEMNNYKNALKIIKNDPMIKNDLVEWKLNEWIDSNK